MNLYESIKVNKIDKKKIIKNKAIPANNQYNVEAENDNEKKLDIVQELANKFVEYLRQHEIFAELDDYSIAENQRTGDVSGVIDYSIEWGDWKHDHLYSEDLAKEFFKEDLSISEDVTEEDGSDTYSATHEFVFDLAPYLGKEMKESDEKYIVVESYEDLPYEDFGASNTIGTLKDDKNFIIFDDNVVYIFEGNIEELKKLIYSDDDEDLKLFDEFMDKNSKRADNELETKILVDTKRLSPEVLDEEEKVSEAEDNKLNESYMHPGKYFKLFQDEEQIDGEKWNNSNQEERDNMVKPQVEEFWNKYKNEMTEEDINKLLDDMEDSNWHTECRILTNIINSEREDNKLNEADRPVATVNDIDKILKMSDKELDDFDRNHSYENSDLAEYVRCRLLYAETGLAKHKECYEKALNSLKNNKLKEADTMDINNLTKEQLWKLRNEIVLGSIYTNDYKNSFGIDPVAVYNFFDSFIEDAQVDDYGKPNNRKTEDYDNADELYKFYCSCENPFGEVDNKLNESSTEERWNATELDREGFYALLKFNNPEEHANPSLKYIITRDGNEVYRFAMSGTNEKIKDTGAKIEFRNFLKSKNNEIEEAEEIKEDADKNAKYVKSTLNKIALDKISNAIVNIEDAVSLINDNDEAKTKIKSIVEELEDYLNLDDYGRPKA